MTDAHHNNNQALTQEREEPPERHTLNSAQRTNRDDNDLPLHSSYVRCSGLDGECPICQSPFEHGDAVCRPTCQHMFHTHCCREHVRSRRTSQEQITCPCCHGSGEVVAQFAYIGIKRCDMSTDSYASADDPPHTFPTWATDFPQGNDSHAVTGKTTPTEAHVETAYHIGTSLPGRVSALVVGAVACVVVVEGVAFVGIWGSVVAVFVFVDALLMNAAAVVSFLSCVFCLFRPFVCVCVGWLCLRFAGPLFLLLLLSARLACLSGVCRSPGLLCLSRPALAPSLVSVLASSFVGSVFCLRLIGGWLVSVFSRR